MSGARSRLGAGFQAVVGLSTGAHLVGLYFLSRGARSLQLILWVLAGLLWLLALAILRRAPPLRTAGERWRAGGLVIGCALLLRLPALALPVTHTDDIHRYLWDGAAQAAGLNPYDGSPESPAFSALRDRHPTVYAHINHRYLPTIYPPVAQALFRLHASFGQDPASPAAVRSWKALVGGLELLACAAILGIAIARHGDVRRAAVWTSCPLVATEVFLNGHLEPLGVLLLLLAWLAWQRAAGRTTVAAGALLAAATLVKPVALAVTPGLFSELRAGSQRGRAVLLVAGAAMCAGLLLLPYRSAGTRMLGSLGEYGRRWRSNDGAYAVIHAVAERGVARFYAPPYYEPWKHPRLARLVTGRDRDTVWPDELTSALARAVCLAALGGLALFALRRRLPAADAGLLLLAGYALLTPTLHPWYLLWPLALLALVESSPCSRAAGAAVLWLGALSPLSYFVEGGAAWARLIEHGAAWAALGVTLRRPLATALQSSAAGPNPRPAAAEPEAAKPAAAKPEGDPDAHPARAPR